MELTLQQWVWLLGAAHLAAGGAGLAAPSAAARALERFPRSAALGRLFSAIALAACAAIVRGAALGRFEPLKPWLYPAAGLVWVGVAALMSDLLAARALGGLLLLAAQPLLVAARFHPSAASRFVSAFAYVWVFAGLVGVAAPWHFRRAAAALARAPARIRAAGAGAVGLGAVFLALGWTRFAP